MMIDREEIVRLTDEYGGDWGIKHAERLLYLISLLDEGMNYNKDAVCVAAYLHDWGGYEAWAVPGVEHYTRSAEVAREFMQKRGYPEDFMDLILECIEYHHGGKSGRSNESVLFTDADALDIIGVAGTVKIFSIVPRNLKGAVAAAKKYRNASTAAITLEKTRTMAEKRLRETDELLKKFEEEMFGMY
jgi:HD superfamily phosphodiesterase